MGLKVIKGKGKAPKPLQIVGVKPVPVSKAKKKGRAKKYGPTIPKKILEARRAASNKVVVSPVKRGRAKQYGPTRATYESRPKKDDDSWLKVMFGTGKKRGRPKGSKSAKKSSKKSKVATVTRRGNSCIISQKDLKDLKSLRVVRR